MSRFRLSAGGSRAHEPWFRIGTLDVGTTWFVVLLGGVGLLAYAVGGADFESDIAFLPDASWTLHHPWSVVTWPLAILFSRGALNFAIGLFFLWYFGRELESSVFGRNKLAWWLVLTTLVFPAVVSLLVALVPGWVYPLFGLQFLGLAVFLLYAAEWPRRLFFWGVPAWILGIIYLAVTLVQYLADRNWAMVFGLLIGLGISAIAARQYGALSEYAWIPRLPGGGPRRPRTRTRKSAQPTVVAGPWQGSSTTAPPVNRDAQRMDELLDKISAHGTESLTAAERRELEELRLRRRR
ncbi:hypothetical protein Back2_24820 [Nocardioides baekrokdamisoli]|uniref:DUF6576 domain-containing protein n=1 Tax=Nocardioides baekrokdamisoli TaxID=1804624 RepID=A0A3G9IQ57_9ACTN|nr:DUF6576 domain-containing protein [Nocardioides baekrokdamisoli]BBH18195.1 hypothetical protein Back2_24820 [Nocardioides baekrokdamisoli]